MKNKFWVLFILLLILSSEYLLSEKNNYEIGTENILIQKGDSGGFLRLWQYPCLLIKDFRICEFENNKYSEDYFIIDEIILEKSNALLSKLKHKNNQLQEISYINNNENKQEQIVLIKLFNPNSENLQLDLSFNSPFINSDCIIEPTKNNTCGLFVFEYNCDNNKQYVAIGTSQFDKILSCSSEESKINYNKKNYGKHTSIELILNSGESTDFIFAFGNNKDSVLQMLSNTLLPQMLQSIIHKSLKISEGLARIITPDSILNRSIYTSTRDILKKNIYTEEFGIIFLSSFYPDSSDIEPVNGNPFKADLLKFMSKSSEISEITNFYFDSRQKLNSSIIRDTLLNRTNNIILRPEITETCYQWLNSRNISSEFKNIKQWIVSKFNSSVPQIGYESLHNLAKNLINKEINIENIWKNNFELTLLGSTIHGLIGLEVLDSNNKIILKPRLPADWDSISVEKIHIGKHILTFKMTRLWNKIRYYFEHEPGNEVLLIDFSPILPLGTSILGLNINSRQFPVNLLNSGGQSHLQVGLSVRAVTVVDLAYTRGISVLPFIESEKNPCQTAEIISQELKDTCLELTLRGYPGKYILDFWDNKNSIASTVDCNIIPTELNNRIKLQTELESNSQEFITKKIKIIFKP